MAADRQRLDKLLSSRGYCSRGTTRALLASGAVLVSGEVPRSPAEKVDPAVVTIEGEPLDPGTGVVLLLNKPAGYTCSHRENGLLVYELMPERFQARNPPLSTVGRLDKETTGVLLLTDDGQLIHRLTSPRHHVPRVYEARLSRPLSGSETEIFASGTMMLEGEDKPLLPAHLEVLEPQLCRVTLHEGRYHQVRRMFAAVGNHVDHLHRLRFGAVGVEGLAEGEFRFLTPAEAHSLSTPGGPAPSC